MTSLLDLSGNISRYIYIYKYIYIYIYIYTRTSRISRTFNLFTTDRSFTLRHLCIGQSFHLLWLDILDYTWATAITKSTFVGLLWSHSLIYYNNIFKLTKLFKNNWILHIPQVFWPLSHLNTAFGKFTNLKVYLHQIIPSY